MRVTKLRLLVSGLALPCSKPTGYCSHEMVVEDSSLVVLASAAAAAAPADQHQFAACEVQLYLTGVLLAGPSRMLLPDAHNSWSAYSTVLFGELLASVDQILQQNLVAS